ncbi:MAG: M3 family oligoendopeptidase [Aggregatilineales bacterium]
MTMTLPESATDAQDWSWAQFQPFTAALIEQELTAETINDWMADWTRFNTFVSEIGSRNYVALTVDTTDEAIKNRYLRFSSEIVPELQKVGDVLNRKLIDSGLTVSGMDVPLRGIKSEIALFREENLPIEVQVRETETEHDEIKGAQTIEWDGEEKTVPQMNPVFMKKDRDTRKKAFNLIHERQLEDRDALNDLWVKLFKLRQEIAKNAGFDNFLEYTWQNYGRFDYSPEDVQQFHQAIEEVCVPTAQRIYAKRQQRMGVDSLRPWDLQVDTLADEPLKPFEKGDELKRVSASIFHQVDPELGAYFDDMRESALLDLDNRKGKAPGGYCIDYAYTKKPFIFMNSVGIHQDVQTMLHEAGHAFHAYAAFEQPFAQQQDPPIEFCEVASMAMELLAAPYLTADKGGFYTESEAARARIEHLEGNILFWNYMAVVDAFQQWAYTSGDAALDPAACDAQWIAIWNRFMTGVDYSGLEDWVATGWHRKMHIYTVPLYYIEYGIAQLGAVQVFANSLKNHQSALTQYRSGLALGNTATLPDLFAATGAKLAFDSATLSDAVTLMEKTIDDLEASLNQK